MTDSDFYLIRRFADGSAVYADDAGRMYFCSDAHDEPQHAHVPCAGGDTAKAWLAQADAEGGVGSAD
jgi:hypothetical protein